ncbi:MAG: glycoside hydrolase family 38 C-terminal domain-containing protein [Lachnospiraceae bacterium]
MLRFHEADGLKVCWSVTGEISNSTFTQYIRLAADRRRIEFETEVDWKEMHRLLKTGFPVNVYAGKWLASMRCSSDSWNIRHYIVPELDKDRLKYVNICYSALADGAHGAAVLNDCKYGISMNGNALELTLLRAGTCPEMCADNRVHHFTYAFTAWEGSFAESDVVRQGYELNVKPVVAGGAALTFSTLPVLMRNVIPDTMKPAI